MSQELITLIKKSSPHAIVKMLYNSEASNDYSEKKQIEFLTNLNQTKSGQKRS